MHVGRCCLSVICASVDVVEARCPVLFHICSWVLRLKSVGLHCETVIEPVAWF